ncbi:hypothetical protein [Nonomuraea sp. CA-141351]|uniref:hypothetical protein n=1 Tax=Nonomuraea sp. CA-141351 TaxID=3239996 RepID=UPI003D8CFB72
MERLRYDEARSVRIATARDRAGPVNRGLLEDADGQVAFSVGALPAPIMGRLVQGAVDLDA